MFKLQWSTDGMEWANNIELRGDAVDKIYSVIWSFQNLVFKKSNCFKKKKTKKSIPLLVKMFFV